MEDPGDFVTDYELSIPAMASLGWQVETVAWRSPDIDWDRYDAVYICTPWDYPDHVGQFLGVLEAIDLSSALLMNPLGLVRWNLAKTYLRDLEARGAAIVPSLWFDAFEAGAAAAWFEALDADKVVIKPQVGANAQDTYVLGTPVAVQLEQQLADTFLHKPFFVQPFMSSVVGEGEYSLFFFNGEYSHAILKTPERGDFRTQEEHGAVIASVTATDHQVRATAAVLQMVEPRPVYARADIVRGGDDDWLLMELELIEPSLYLRTDPGSAGRFARAVDERFQVLAGK